MPTLLRAGRFRFFIVMADCREPPHVHVSGGGGQAKVWLSPVALESAAAYSRHELRAIERLAMEYQATLMDRWDEECRALD